MIQKSHNHKWIKNRPIRLTGNAKQMGKLHTNDSELYLTYGVFICSLPLQ